MITFRRKNDYSQDLSKAEFYEKNNEESMTVPGESMTIKELIARQKLGQDIQERNANYLDQDNLDLISEFYRPMTDLTDLDQLKAHNKALDEFAKQMRNKENEARKAAKDIKDIEAEPVIKKEKPEKVSKQDKPKEEGGDE